VTAKHLRQGAEAEAACCNYLLTHGLKLVEKNFSSRLGEIDIIMHDKNILVFVEVRFRKNNAFGGGLESITPAKQNKLRKTAELYMQHNSQYKIARFDVVAMSARASSVDGKQPGYIFEWIKNAF
jgi:putative endonuclease